MSLQALRSNHSRVLQSFLKPFLVEALQSWGVPRHFSTEEGPAENQAPSEDASARQDGRVRPPLYNRGEVKQDRLKHFQGGWRPQDSSPFVTETGSVCACIRNFPTLMLKSDLLRFFEDCQLDPESVKLAYSETLKPLDWYIEFPSPDSYNLAQNTSNRPLGTRTLKIHPVQKRVMAAMVNRIIPNAVRERTVSVSNLPHKTTQEEIERLFPGFAIAGKGITILRSPGSSNRPFAGQQDNDVDVSALVTFTTKMEALRALRDGCHDVIMSTALEVSYVQ